jgi:nucleotide-binding universal stress UspA family protein
MTIDLKRILVPIDFSPQSQTALQYGIAHAEKFGAALHLLHVLEVIAGPPEPLAWDIQSRQTIEQAIEEKAWDELRRQLTADEQKRLRAELAVEWGSPLEEILRYAKEHTIDLVTLGTHGRGGVKRLLIGSVAENVVRHADCPVLTVHHPEHDFVTP